MVVNTPARTAMPEVAISWAGDGTFAGTYDSMDGRVISDTLTVEYGRDVARPLGEPLVSTAQWVLWNPDRLLSPEWAGSPIYQQVIPGKPTRVRLLVGETVDYDDPRWDYDAPILYDGQETLDIHAGILDRPSHQPVRGMPTVEILSAGALSRLTKTKLSTPLVAGQRVDECIEIVLDAVNWPADLRDLALADTTLEWFWVADETPFEVLVRLQHSEGPPSLIWEGPDGVIHFEHRNYRGSVERTVTPQEILADSRTSVSGIAYPDGEPTLYYSGIAYEQPFEDVYNEAICPVVTRLRQPLQKVWEQGSALPCNPNETKLIKATLSDPADGFVTPVLATDYDLTQGSLTVPPTIVESSATSITVTMTAGALGAIVVGVTSDGWQIRATPVTSVSEKIVVSTSDASASIARYDPIGNRPLPLTLQAYPEINEATAQALCNAAVAFYQDVRPIITIRIVNFDLAQAVRQVYLRPGDRLTVYSEPLGLSGDLWIEQVAHRLIPEGLETVLACERALTQPGAAIWDDPSSLWDDPDTLWGQ